VREKRNALAKQAEQTKGKHYVADQKLADNLNVLLGELFLEGRKNVNTMSPGTVAMLGAKLDKLLVANGVIRPSKRTVCGGSPSSEVGS
jgi:hypothetical protein